MRDSMHILDVLRERGYEPQEDARPDEGWFDRCFDRRSTDAAVRVILADDEVRLHRFGQHGALEWTVRFYDGTPSSVILAALDAAEREAGGQQGSATVCGCCADNECECQGANLRQERA